MPITLADILQIPGNEAVFNKLKQLLQNEKAVAFVGAGASAGLYPLWGKFIELLADHAVHEGKAGPKDAKRWKADTTCTPQQRVNTILRKLGEPLYREFLRNTFGPTRSDGKRYTPQQAALLRLPFRGYVTTNYDPALDFARAEIRPDSLSTGTPTWKDHEEVYRWRTGTIFEQDCPMLWLHGYWQRPDGIVLNTGEYGRAYMPGIYRDTLKELWIRERLVFVGFGFNDPQFTIMVGEFLRSIEEANAVPRHIAILGWPLPLGRSRPDVEAIKEKRDMLESDFHVIPLFFQIVKRREGAKKWDDYSALEVLLEAVASGCGRAMPVVTPSGAAVAAAVRIESAPDFHAKWIHETSNDGKFTGREDEFSRLNKWVRDEAVRAVAVCAVGGTGKTALIGRWLKETDGWRSRPFTGLFGWSFYQNRDSNDFLKAFLVWAHEAFGAAKPDQNTKLVSAALAVLRKQPYVVVLDGLEVLQQGPEEARHGAFLDGALREFLTAFCQQEHRSLAVLTSRFVFADLERYLGTAFHQVELHGLPAEQGANLLDELGVRGTVRDRKEISERLEGHPLGLRVFAGALPDVDRDNPLRFLDHAFDVTGLPPDAPLAKRVTSLLSFYDKKLPRVQIRLLSVVALFRAPVADATVVHLARGLFGDKTDDALPDDATLAAELQKLHTLGILSREPVEGGHGSACHPILRDHFRSVLLGSGPDAARRAADLLQGQPSAEKPRSVKEIEPVLLAIELLLDAGEFKAADELYRGRLEEEGASVFLTIPAMAEGLACSLGFVRDEARRQQCEAKLSQSFLAFYLNAVGFFASYCGQYELALEYYAGSSAIYQAMQKTRHLSRVLVNEADLLLFLGRLAEAQRKSAEALRLSSVERNESEVRNCRVSHGWAAVLSGQLWAAAEDFACANEIVKRNGPDGDELYGIHGIWWAELLLRTGHLVLAGRRTEANLRICERNHSNQDIARCHWMLGACALAEGRLDDAEAQLQLAEPILHRGQMLFWLARVHITAGHVALARQDLQSALGRAAEALTLATPRGMRLIHADALVLRGRARLLERLSDSAPRALDDAEEALRIARGCGYAWAERDALFLQAEACIALDRRVVARRLREDAEALAARLALTQADLDDAEAKAKAWLAEWERSKPKSE
jgi:hypothetical protein